MSSSSSSNNNNSFCSSRKRQRRDIVSEEEYNNTLETIITRDYYSELPELQKQAAILDRRAAKDLEGTVRVRRAARRIQLLEEKEQELEALQEGVDSNSRQTPRPLHRENLSGFHARVTSEDNAEFAQQHQKELEQHRQQLSDKYQGPFLRLKEHGEQQRQQHDYDYEPLASEQHATSNVPPSRKQVQVAPISNNLFFEPSALGDANTNSARTMESQEDSSLMPPPPKMIKQALVEYIPKHMMEKRIEPSQTRFPSASSRANSNNNGLTRYHHLQTNAHAHHQGADSDSEAPSDGEASTDLDSVFYNQRPLTMERQARQRQQRRELQTMIPMSPSPLVQHSDNDGVSPPPPTVIANIETVMERSNIAVLNATAGGLQETVEEENGGSLEGKSSFALPDESDRDKAAQQAQATLERRRIQAKTTSTNKQTTTKDMLLKKTPKSKRPRTTTNNNNVAHGGVIGRRDLSSFSPAAMSLFSKTTSQSRNPFSARSSSALGSALRSSYTPQRTGSSSSRRMGTGGCSHSRRGKDHAYNSTPRREAATEEEVVMASSRESQKQTSLLGGKSTTTRNNTNVTDGLLNLPP